MSEHKFSQNLEYFRVTVAAGVAQVDRSSQRTSDVNPAKISVRNLNFYYGSRRRSSTFPWIFPSEVVTAFIGPSGCGKSTFLRTLNRMNDILPGTRVEGEVLIDGADIYAPTTDVVDLRLRVGMVFQKSNPFPKSIFDNVAYGLRINRMTSSKSELAGARGTGAEGRGALGRGERSSARIGAWFVRRPATAIVHRASAGYSSQRDPDG